jgi:OOP family OmpA-OmpF porin
MSRTDHRANQRLGRAVLALSLIGSIGAAFGQPASGVLERATPEQLIEQLAPAAPAPTRSLQRNLVPERRQVDLVVNFDFGSDRVQGQSQPILESLAQALNHPRLQAMRFLVEGHTDARGNARYNEELSIRRARAVADVLKEHGVAAERLQPEGRGFSDLLNKAQPEAAENRRVRIITIAP